MSELLALLTSAVTARSHHDTVALLLSGGIDSLSAGMALQAAGKHLHAYTFCLEGHPSRDVRKAREIAAHFGWSLTVITVPVTNVASDFRRLAVEQRCRTKTQFEVAFPFLYVMQQIEEGEVWTAFNADDHYGNDRESMFRYRRMAQQSLSIADRKRAFDEERRAKFAGPLSDPESDDTWSFVRRIAAQHGKELLDPYLDKSVCEYFLRFDQEQLSPLSKPHIRHALRDPLKRIPRRTLAVGIRLQKGASVSTLFAELLRDEAINRFDKKYTTVSALCQRWGSEVHKDGGFYLAEAQALPPPPSAAKFMLKPGVYRPYRMEEVWASPGHGLTAIETFAGGGGSGLGLHQAGYKVVLANEFVPEAARTYRVNFSQTAVDMRDIRDIAVSPASIERFLLQAGLRPGEPSLLAGSFPCAEFSGLGGGLSDQSRLRTYSDTKQRGMSTLIFEFVKLARGAMPEAVIAENVPALATTYRQLLDGALDILRFTAMGRERVYYANYAVLSADDFGTPQARRRLFIVAVRRDVAHWVGITSDAGVATLFPGPTHLPVSMRSALSCLHQTPAHIDPWRAEMRRSSSLRYFVNKLPPDPSDWLKLRDVGLSEKSWFTLVRCAWDRPAPTMTVLGQLPNSLSGAIHPEYDRKFTLPELKRLTGLPDDFRLTGTLNQAVERVCRMVPPALMRAVAESIYERVLRPYREQRK